MAERHEKAPPQRFGAGRFMSSSLFYPHVSNASLIPFRPRQRLGLMQGLFPRQDLRS
jgi:hypothetical protein